MNSAAKVRDRFDLFAGLRRAVELLAGRKPYLEQNLDDVPPELLRDALGHIAQLESLTDEFSDRFAAQLAMNEAGEINDDDEDDDG